MGGVSDIKTRERPRFINWLLTARCNLNCCHCYAARLQSDRELETGQALNLVREAAAAGVKHIGFTGGEVLLRPDIMELMESVYELGMSTSVVTNGSILNDEVAEKLAEYDVYTLLSIDGATRETHEKIRGSGSWDFLLPTMARLQQFGVRFSTIMAVNKLNFGEVSEYITLAQQSGASAACLIPVMPVGRAKRELILKPEQMLTVLQVADKTAGQLKFHISFWCTPFAGLVTRPDYTWSSFCRSITGDIDIAPSGDVLLCDVLDMVLANVRQDRFAAAWQARAEHPVIEALVTPDLAEACLDCPLKDECKGGCFARAQFMTGDLYSPDPLCPRVAKVI
jgi:radical SAM protein with 4Fe4S-binding SPASM domain